jgi:hypothetical protein
LRQELAVFVVSNNGLPLGQPIVACSRRRLFESSRLSVPITRIRADADEAPCPARDVRLASPQLQALATTTGSTPSEARWLTVEEYSDVMRTTPAGCASASSVDASPGPSAIGHAG